MWYIEIMRLLFVADGRSPTALSWMRHWIETGHETHLVSTFPCDPPPNLASFQVLGVAFGGYARHRGNSFLDTIGPGGAVQRWSGILRRARYVLGPMSLTAYRKRFRRIVKEIRPDLVHALRIPFEGMLAEATPEGIPIVVSTWGNDLTLHASGSFLMSRLTRRTLLRASGLISDTARDIRLACDWGFTKGKPTIIIPGAGGIRLDEIKAVSPKVLLPEVLAEVPIVVNPRGQRPGSLRQDVFFQSIPMVLEKIPQAVFICLQLAGDRKAERWVDVLGIRANTRLWNMLNREQVLALFKRARVYVSPSIHDGTPNSLLEAMACGCFPVVGNVDSIREWVTPGVNGLLVDATSARELANGIITALEDRKLYEIGRNKNALIIAERADQRQCMAMTEAFYRNVVGSNS